jgi:hypothetical protein
LEAARGKCKFNLQSDIGFYVTNEDGTKVVDESRFGNLCSNDCSNNGVCSDGEFFFK